MKVLSLEITHWCTFVVLEWKHAGWGKITTKTKNKKQKWLQSQCIKTTSNYFYATAISSLHLRPYRETSHEHAGYTCQT